MDLELKQKHIDNNWKTISQLVGDTKLVEVSEEVFNQIKQAVKEIETAENVEADNLAVTQNLFAASMGTYVEPQE